MLIKYISSVYIKNLNEKIKIPELKSTLQNEFSQFGNIIDIVAHKNLRMRGQAFVVFESIESAQKAQESYKNHELFGKPMILQFAKTRSEAAVKQTSNETDYEQYKKERLRRKEERGHIKQKKDFSKKRQKGTQDQNKKNPKKLKTTPSTTTDTQGELPPNKVLFLENLPPGVSQDELSQIFSAYPGFIEIRLVPVRRLGFVEYYSDEEAVVAKEATTGLIKDGYTVKITYAKK